MPDLIEENYSVSNEQKYKMSISLDLGEDPEAPKSYLGRQLGRFQMGNKWFTTFVSKGQFVLMILTYLAVKEIDLPWMYGIPIFLSLITLVFVIGCVDDWRGWTKRELIGHQTQFSPYWNPKDGYYAKQLRRVDQRVEQIWMAMFGEESETGYTETKVQIVNIDF